MGQAPSPIDPSGLVPQVIADPSRSLLVVEDSDEDFEALTRLMRNAQLSNSIHRCIDGEEALDFLHRRGPYAQSTSLQSPSIILLDLNLPGTDGREVLREIKEDKILRKIPVVILTTSSSPKDIETCYSYGVNSYLLKPMDLKAFKRLIQVFIEYWFSIVVLPDAKTIL